MVTRALTGFLRLGSRLAVAFIVFDFVRTGAIPSAAAALGLEFAESDPSTVALLAQLAGGLLAGAITIIVGKGLYDTFLPVARPRVSGQRASRDSAPAPLSNPIVVRAFDR